MKTLIKNHCNILCAVSASFVLAACAAGPQLPEAPVSVNFDDFSTSPVQQANNVTEETTQDQLTPVPVGAVDKKKLDNMAQKPKLKSDMSADSWAGKTYETASSGTGFLLNATGEILTAAHVVDECKSLDAKMVNGASFEVMPYIINTSSDLAILKSQPKQQAPVVMTREIVANKQPAFVVGFPEGKPYKATRVTVDNNVYKPGQGMIGLNGGVQLGNSGGPLVTEKGYVFGVVKSKVDTKAYFEKTGQIQTDKGLAVSVEKVESFLKEAQVKATFKEDQPNIETGFTQLSNAVVRINCNK